VNTQVDEPVKVKEFINQLISSGVSPRYAVWLGNRLAKYLWDVWGDELRASGVRWQDFLRFLAGYEDVIISWVEGKVGWASLIDALVKGLSERVSLRRSTGLGRWLGSI
jgi:hypothetical protein